MPTKRIAIAVGCALAVWFILPYDDPYGDAAGLRMIVGAIVSIIAIVLAANAGFVIWKNRKWL